MYAHHAQPLHLCVNNAQLETCGGCASLIVNDTGARLVVFVGRLHSSHEVSSTVAEAFFAASEAAAFNELLEASAESSYWLL